MSAKLPSVKDSIVMHMSDLARKHEAIDLTQSFPDIETAKELKDLACKYIHSDNNQYAPIEGVPELRQVVADKLKNKYNSDYQAESEITIHAGTAEALYSTITAFVDEDDEVIIFEPAYDNYSPIVRLNGGKPIYVHLSHPDYAINWEQVKMHITARTRMIILNTPHNPSGKILKHDDFEKLAKIVSNSNIIVLCDEVYEHLVFPENKHYSLAQFPALTKRGVIVSSFGKALNVTNWKMAYSVAHEDLAKQIRRIHRFVNFSCNKPLQYALAEYIREYSPFEKIGEFYQKKRQFFVDLLKKTKFKALPTEGTFFLLLDYSAISSEKDFEFAVKLTEEFGVATVPASELYHQKEDHKLLRVCFAKPNEILQEVAERLALVSKAQ